MRTSTTSSRTIGTCATFTDGSFPARKPLVEHSPVPFGRPPGTTITRGDQYLWDSGLCRCSVEIAGHRIDGANPFLDYPHHLHDSRGVTDPSANLVAGGHGRRRLRRSIVDSHMSASACRGGVRPGFCQPDRPQPPIDAGGFHASIMRCSGAELPQPSRRAVTGSARSRAAAVRDRTVGSRGRWPCARIGVRTGQPSVARRRGCRQHRNGPSTR